MSTARVRPPATPNNPQEQLNFSLHQIDEASYPSLDITEMRHSEWVLSHVLHGCVQTTTYGHTCVARDGDVMIHPPQLPFSEYSIIAGTHQWLALDIQVWPQLDLLQRYPVSPVVTLHSPEEYSRVFRRLSGMWQDSSAPARDVRLMSLSLELLGLVIESWEAGGAVPRPAPMQTGERFQNVVAHMTQHMQSKIAREELARMAHLHPGYFDRVFRAHYGVAPMQMLRDLRLRRAQELLQSSSATLEVIAQQCGLGNAAQFSRTFRHHFGQTPGEYRESAKQTKQSYLRSMEKAP
jgi:AraC-like DNA-binding protein